MKPIKFLLIFHSLFFIVSMVVTLLFEKLGGEIFAGIFWFNIIYLITGCTIWLLLFIATERICKGKTNQVLLVNLIVGLFLVNGLVYFLSDYVPFYTVIIGISRNKIDEFFWIALLLQGGYLLSYLSVSFLYKKRLIIKIH